MQKGRKMTGEIFKKLVIFGFGLVFVFLFFEIENAQAAVSFVGSAENSSVGNTDTTVDLTTITGLAQDDLVIVTGGIGDDDNVNHDVIVNTTGYTEVADLFADDTDDANVAVWYKFMGATPDTSVVVEGSTGGTDSSIAVVVMVFRGVNTTTPMDVTPTTVTGINTMHPNPPSIDHLNPAGLWTVIAGGSVHLLGGTSTYTFPTGYTTNAIDRGSDDTNDITVGMGYRSSGVSDPEDPGVMTHSGTDTTSTAWAAATIALRPSVATITLGDGTNPGNATIAPGAAATDIDNFSLVTSAGTDTVTAVTVTLGPAGAFNNIGQADITNTGNTAQCTAITNPASNTLSFTGCSIPVSATAADFKVRITPKTHANMAVPPGAEYATTGTVTAFTSTNGQAGTDTGSATVTVDNLSPNGATTVSGSAGGEANTVNWTTSNGADFNTTSGSVIYRWASASAGSEVPTEGGTPAIGAANGTATTACVVSSAASTAQSKIDGTGGSADCTTSALTNGQAYTYKAFQKDTNGNYDVGVLIGTFTPSGSLTISQTAGTKVATKDSGAVDQYAHDTACTGAASCAAFTLAASGGTVNVTSIKITENGTVTANTELSDINLYYDTDGNWSDAGAETLFGTAASFAADQTATISGTLAISSGATAYIYVRYDLANGTTYPIGGATANFQIAAAGDVVSDGTESGSGTLAGTQTVLPTADSVTYAVSPDGGRTGDTATISGKGFGAPPADADQQDCVTATVGSKGCVRFNVGGAYTVQGIDISTWNNTTITFIATSTITTFGGASALEVVSAAQSTPTDLTYYIYPNITTISGTPSADAQREGSNVDINGTRFDISGNQGTVTFTGGFGSVAATVVSWSDTLVTVTVPAGISDSVYLGDITLTRAAGTGSKTDTAYGSNTFRILPKIDSMTPALKGGRGDTGFSLSGDHLCQSGTCPTAFAAADSVNFNGASVTSGASTWTHTSIPSITIPAAAVDGNVNITSNTSYTSNSLTFDVKFAPSTPTGSSAGGNNNPTLSGNAFSDGTDGDTHAGTEWQIAHNSDADWLTPEWTRTAGTAEVGTTVNSTNGTFANGDSGQSALDCGTTYKGRVRYKDNSAVTSQEWSAYSADYTFTTASCNASPTLSIAQPDGTGDTVTVGDLYNVTYTLSDTDNVVTAAFYYDINNTGLDGTAISGACATAAEGSGVTCSWNTAGMTPGTYYVYGLTSDGVNPQVSAYSSGVITITQVSISTTGTQTVNIDSGATGQYVGAAFRFQQVAGTADTITAITISETSASFNANTNGSNATIRYETANAGGCTYDGTETISKTGVSFDASDKAIFTTLTSNIPLTLSPNYTCVYFILDVNGNAAGGQTIEAEVTASADFTLSGGTNKAGTYPAALAGITTIRPNVTDPTDSTLADGGRNGETFTITGTGFGTACASISAQVGTLTLTCNSANNTTISATIPSAQTTTFGGTGSLLVTVGGTADDAGQTYYIYPNITTISGTPSADAQREGSNVDINGTRFDISGNQGTVTFTGGFGSVAATVVSWADTLVTVTVPAAIADNVYLGDITLTRAAGTGSKTDTAYGGNTFRILPKINSLSSTSGTENDSITVIGNHLCQSGTCPTAFSYVSPVNNVLFGATNANNPTTWSWGHGNSSTLGVDVKVPAGSGTKAVKVISADYESDTINFNYLSTTPNSPTGLLQYKSDGVTLVSTGGTVNGTTLVFEGDLSAQTSVTMALQVEVKAKAIAFAGTVTATSTVSTGSSVANKQVTVSGLTDVTDYHWRARAINTNTYEISAWVAYGDNPTGDGSTDGATANIDFSIDASGPVISSVCAVNPTASSCDSSQPTDIQAQIRWSTNENATRQVAYGTSCGTGADAATVFTNTANKQPSSPSGVASSPHGVILSGLTANTTYYYKIRSSDTAGNISYNPSDTTCLSFGTTAAQTRIIKTLEFFIEQATTTTGSLSKTFDIFISESKADRSNIYIKSASVDIFGTSVGDGAGDITVTTDLNSYQNVYTLSDPGANKAISWKTTYATSTLNFDCVYCTDNASINNTLTVTVAGPSSTSLLGAKAIMTYYYEPL